MKGVKIQLTNRKDVVKKPITRTVCSKLEYSPYEDTTLRYPGASTKNDKTNEIPKLAVTTLFLPENFSFNTGSSLEKWSKKQPRLRSATKHNKCKNQDSISDEFSITFDMNEILDKAEEEEEEEEGHEEEERHDCVDTYEKYVVSADIEELLLKSQKEEQENDHGKKKKRRRGRENEKQQLKKKSIRFSFSKPSSPETEQVIRVDVTSNVSLEETTKETVEGEGCARSQRMINEGRKIFNERDLTRLDDDDEDFIVRCRQLAITRKGKKR